MNFFEDISKSNSDAQNRNSVLAPGQQVVLTQWGDLVIKNVDQNAAIAWKNGLFSLKNEDIQRVLKQFERWYDIEVIYEGIIPKTTFSGKIHKSAQIDKVLSLLDYYKVTYEVTGRQIKITGKQIN